MIFATPINGSIVLINDIFTLLAVRLHDEFLHLFDSQIDRDNAGDAEEGRLEDGVRAVAQTDFLCNLRSVDVVNRNILLGEITLNIVRQVLSQFFAFPDCVQEECTILAETTSNIVHVEISLNVASHEVRRIHQISRADRMVAEAEVRASETTGLLRVVGEVSLAILVGVITDNLHGVLVGTYCTVGTEAVELRFEHTVGIQSDFFFLRERSKGNVVFDTDSELVLRHSHRQVFVNSQDLSRSCILGTQTVAATDYQRSIFYAVEAILHVEIQRFAVSTRLFRAVKDSNTLSRLRNSSQEVLSRERTIQVDRNQADFFALSHQVVNGFADSLRYRTHGDDDAVCVFGTVVIEQAVLASCNLGDFVHVFFHNCRNLLVE